MFSIPMTLPTTGTTTVVNTVALAHTEAAEIIPRKINTVAREIVADVARNVSQLQRGRKMTSVLNRRIVTISEARKRDVGDRRDDELAVVQQLIEVFVARL